MYRLLRLQLVFCFFRLDIISKNMSFFVTVVIGNLIRISPFYINKGFEMTFDSWSIIFSILLFIMSLLLYHFLFLLLSFIEGFSHLFSLVNLTLILVLVLESYFGLFWVIYCGLFPLTLRASYPKAIEHQSPYFSKS